MGFGFLLDIRVDWVGLDVVDGSGLNYTMDALLDSNIYFLRPTHLFMIFRHCLARIIMCI